MTKPDYVTKGSHKQVWAAVYSGSDETGEWSSNCLVYYGKAEIGSVDLEFTKTLVFELPRCRGRELSEDILFSSGDLELLAKIVKSLESDDEEMDLTVWEKPNECAQFNEANKK